MGVRSESVSKTIRGIDCWAPACLSEQLAASFNLKLIGLKDAV